MPFLGIDLGTTFSAMAYLDSNGTPTTIPNSEGELTTPSAVLFEKSGDIVVGREARRTALAEPESVAECVKRHMGDPIFPKVIQGKNFSPVEISALILLKLSQDAKKKIQTIDGVVITVPAYFDEARRQATAKAGELAGLNVVDIINEPTSAALAFAYRSFSKELTDTAQIGRVMDQAPPRTVMVYDLGGGTFDVTILRMAGKDLSVLATAGDVRLGGRDWDERLFKHMADQFMHAHGEDPREGAISLQNLMLATEETKKVLSSRKRSNFVINHAGKSFAGEITREQFEELTQDLLYRSENRLNRVLKQAQLTWPQIDEVLAVGGSTRMPQVLKMLQRVTGREPDLTLSPDEAVAHGAAIHAAICATRPKAPPKLRAGAASGIGPAAAPTRAMPGAPNAAAGAAAVTAPGVAPAKNFLKQRVVDLLRSIHTTNVNAYSLGVVVRDAHQNRRVSMLIPSNTPLPCSIKRRFGTVRDNQTFVTVRVVEGESPDPAECVQVGACSIQRLPDGLPKGSPVEVTFTYDSSGRLDVEAVEITSGKWANATIDRGGGLTEGKSQLEHLRRLNVT